MMMMIIINPWHYSSEESRPIKVVVTRWQYRGLVVNKALSLNFNFSFLNQISLLLISSSSPIVLTRPVPNPILPEKLLGYSQESNT